MRLPHVARLLPLLAGAALPLLAQDPAVARQVRIAVVATGTDAPVGYSVVAAPDFGIERFTGASGTIVIAVPPGPVRLTVKRLGFSPKDTTILVTEAASQSVVIGLARLSVRLDEVRIEAPPPCRAPGAPAADRDAGTAAVLEQLRQNAERFALLLKTYPFVYTVERTLSEAVPGQEEVVNAVDTLLYNGEPRWSYRRGTVLRASAGNIRSRNYTMQLPTLRDFASPEFMATHCFHVSGVEEKLGERLLRMDILASERLRDADVDVVVWLDTADFRIQFATLTLTRIPSAWRHVERLQTEITYVDLIPYAPVMYVTHAENLERADPAKARRWLEKQQILEVRYLGARPDDPLADTTGVRPPE